MQDHARKCKHTHKASQGPDAAEGSPFACPDGVDDMACIPESNRPLAQPLCRHGSPTMKENQITTTMTPTTTTDRCSRHEIIGMSEEQVMHCLSSVGIAGTLFDVQRAHRTDEFCARNVPY